jgi:hypothetical protein
MEELHTDSIDGGHEASYGARSRARERAYSNKGRLRIGVGVVCSFSYASWSVSGVSVGGSVGCSLD